MCLWWGGEEGGGMTWGSYLSGHCIRDDTLHLSLQGLFVLSV